MCAIRVIIVGNDKVFANWFDVPGNSIILNNRAQLFSKDFMVSVNQSILQVCFIDSGDVGQFSFRHSCHQNHEEPDPHISALLLTHLCCYRSESRANLNHWCSRLQWRPLNTIFESTQSPKTQREFEHKATKMEIFR